MRIVAALRDTSRRCATQHIYLGSTTQSKFYCPPTQLFAKNSFLRNLTFSATNTFVFGVLEEYLIRLQRIHNF
jgi:hypothetical protein